ncbi:unnamed protein product [Paramecium octaurelia]|uniref:Uncharacterized protein n=1 Tax=Paramecium octaurelia TaxID=43137 RepID=A0A8S1UYP0_PAROT|nr:unnamed protein product [Paramecium octaurelia]
MLSILNTPSEMTLKHHSNELFIGENQPIEFSASQARAFMIIIQCAGVYIYIDENLI